MIRNTAGIILILLALGVMNFWTRPLWVSTRVSLREKEELETTLSRFQELKRVRDDLLEKYNSISKEDLGRMEEFLPQNQEAGLLLVNLESLSASSGVLLRNIEVQTQREEEPLPLGEPQRLPLSLSFSSPYATFRSFLKVLEEHRRLIDVERISFSAGGADSYEFSVQAHTYWQK